MLAIKKDLTERLDFKLQLLCKKAALKYLARFALKHMRYSLKYRKKYVVKFVNLMVNTSVFRKL